MYENVKDHPMFIAFNAATTPKTEEVQSVADEAKLEEDKAKDEALG